MNRFKAFVRASVDPRIRDSVWALRSRGDASVFSSVLRGALDWRLKAGTVDDHLAATFGWLYAAQDATDVGGVAAFYDVRAGCWAPPYPETTGYIIPTFFEYAALRGEAASRNRALRMADWLLTLQLENGAFPIGPLWPNWERAPIVFDTGQIIQGLVRAHLETGRLEYLDAAARAGAWLLEIQDSDGCWRRCTSLGHVHTYNVRVAWALLQLDAAAGDSRFRGAATRNLRWALTQQAPDGWFANSGFRPDEMPLTHTIAYTIEGILESGILLKDEVLISAARLAADRLMECQERDGGLRARYGEGWRSDTQWSCLTGNAQLALAWFRLHEHVGDRRYLDSALEANHCLRTLQVRKSPVSGVAGGLAGSYPIYGDYEPYRNLNWAAKFFADSLLAERRLQDRSSLRHPPQTRAGSSARERPGHL